MAIKLSQFINFYLKNGEVKRFKGNIAYVKINTGGWVNVFFDDGSSFCANNETYETNINFNHFLKTKYEYNQEIED